MIRYLLILLAILSVEAQAVPACDMRDRCRQISGLDNYLKGDSQEPSPSDKSLLRECMRDVRTSNRILLAGSKPGCTVADDQAFKLLVKLGQQELSEYQARAAKTVDDVVFEDKPCFGDLCWQTSKGWAGRYYPNRRSDSETSGTN